MSSTKAIKDGRLSESDSTYVFNNNDNGEFKVAVVATRHCSYRHRRHCHLHY
ncbi:hypothetical protein LguiA_007994 [Lonicera macranthoides]